MKNEKAQNKKVKKTVKSVRAYTGKQIIKSDVQGSYTGVSTENKYEKPVQDADDL